ncbi:MAG: c-type cytochrome [Planctomycetota bacterium]
MRALPTLLLSPAFVALLAVTPIVAAESQAPSDYRSPLAVVVAPNGGTLYVCDRTAGCVEILELPSGKLLGEVRLDGEPADVAIAPDGKSLFVALRQAGAVAVVDTATRKVTGRIAVGPWPAAVRLNHAGATLFTCNRGDHTVSIVDIPAGKESKRVPVVRDPFSLAVTPDDARLVVTNYMPSGPATNPTFASEVSVIDVAAGKQVSRVKLPPGTTALGGACVSPDGRFAYCVHAVARFHLPITQLERGWVHTYAMSIIELATPSRLATVLLDDITRGAADPWGAALSPDGKTLYITHAGVHEVSRLDLGLLHALLEGQLPPELAKLKDGMRDNVWVRIAKDRSVIADLTNDLTALYIAGVVRRVKTGGRGPRGLALDPAGGRLYVANYFSGNVGVIEAAEGRLLGQMEVGDQPEPGAARRGEIYFHDATRCFQSWHSCFSCHLDDGRIDGLTWDFMRDGMGNGKDVISLVGIEHTSPHNRRATRPDPRECMSTGVVGSHLIVPEESDVEDLLAYALSLKPERNPVAEQLSEAAARGKVLFDGKADCARCHPAPWFTDRLMHNVGLLSDLEHDGRYDTPSLVEAYRTAPYFHDGRAGTLKEALTDHDPEGHHGNLKGLTPQEIDDLVAYLLTL